MVVVIVPLMAFPHVFAEGTIVMPYNPDSRVVIDGAIGEGEYAGSFRAIEMTVYWEHDNKYMYIGLASPGTGWVAIGFLSPKFAGHEGLRGGANMILAVVENDGSLKIYDLVGEAGFHYNASIFSVVEAAGALKDKVVVEFKYPLKFSENDPYDIPELEPGKPYTYLLAYHETSTDITLMHSRATFGEFYVGDNLPSEEEPPKADERPGAPFLSRKTLRILFIFGHIIGLAFGVGGVTVNAVLMMKARSDKELASIMVKVEKAIGPLIFLGLGLLTLSGIGFLGLGYPLTRTLSIKLFLVAALWAEGPLIRYHTSRLAKLALGPNESSSLEFLSTKKKVQALRAVGVILWYATTILGVLLR